MPRDYEAEAYLSMVGRARKASDDLVHRHLLLAVKLAGQYRGRGVSYADLIGEANLALVQAARNYPNSLAKANGVLFGKYAARAIRNRLIEAIRRAEPVHINHTAWAALNKVRAEEGTDEEIAASTGGLLSVDTIRYLRGLVKALDAVSLEEPLYWQAHGEPVTPADVAADPSQNVEEEVLASLERQELRERLREALSKVGGLGQLAISLRFGIEPPGFSEVSLDAVLQVCQRERVLESGMARMRRRMTADDNTRAGAVVSGDRRYPVSLIYSKFGPGRAARIERDQSLWRRVASEPPPAVLGAK